MRKSFFLKLALIIIPIFLLLEGAQTYFSYRSVYDASLKTSKSTIRKIADISAEKFRYYNPETPQEKYIYSDLFTTYCDMFDVTYIYAIKPDVKTKSEEYIAIGFGENASEEAMKTRYPGVVVKGKLTDDEINVYNGNKEYIISHEITPFDDSLICYYPVYDLYDYKRHKMEKLDKPIIIGAEVSFSDVMEDTNNNFFETAIYSFITSFVMAVALFVVLHFKINGPVKKISKRMKNFVSDRDKGVEKLKVKGIDELAEMSRSFNTMADEIDNYINHIDELTKEKHTQEAELDIARNIQKGLLMPSQYNNESVSIDAVMRAAKNVGGDLYDYRVMDDGKVFVAIADVSGKGISGALFMSRAITLLHQYALLGYSPAKMLTEYNNTLAESNPNGLFITTFVAVYNPENSELIYSNAGHNHPYIISDSVIELDGAAGIAAGIFDGYDYEQETVLLKPNDAVFMYTDGVNEAENKSKEMYGTEKLENELKKYIGRKTGSLSEDILKTVDEFSNGAVQNDDITILTFIAKQELEHIEITVDNKAENLTQVNDMINNWQSISADTKTQLLLIAEELFVNICFYAYGENKGEITVSVDKDRDKITLTFTDSGEPFDPTQNLVDIDDYDHDNSIGGLGRFLAFEMADDYFYSYSDGKNILTIVRNIEHTEK